MQFFKRFVQVFLPTVLLFGLLSSCAEDGLDASIGNGNADSEGEGKTYAERTCYFVFDIDTGAESSETRATYDDVASGTAGNGDYVYGDEYEHHIGKSGNYAFFFDEGGLLKAITGLSLPTDEHDLTPNEFPKVEARYTTVLRSTESNFPKEGWKVLVVLNGKRLYQELRKQYAVGEATEENVLSYVWEDSDNPTKIGWDDDDENNTNAEGNDGDNSQAHPKNLFVMTNSAYVENGEVLVAVPITKEMIHEVDDEEDLVPDPELTDDQILKIRVERMVSKFSLELGSSKNSDGKDNLDGMTYTPDITTDLSQNHQVNICTGWNQEYKYIASDGTEKTVMIEDWQPELQKRNWKAEVLSWGMNALETESHLFKHIKGNGNYFTNWNNENYFRSYWAEDPHYKEDYPWQYRWAVNKKLNWYGPDNPTLKVENWKNLLVNYPWTDVHLDYQPGQIIYTPENTYDSNSLLEKLDGRTDLLAGTHLIVRTQLWVQKSVGSQEYQVVEPLYRDRTGVCYTSAKFCLWGLVRAFNWALATQTKMQYRYYDWSSSTDEPVTLYAVPTSTYDENAVKGDDGNYPLYKLYYKDKELDYHAVMAMDEEECKNLLAEANIKDGDGKRLLNTERFSIKREIVVDGKTKLEDLPIYKKYDVGVYGVEKTRYDSEGKPMVDDNGNPIKYIDYEEYDNSPYLLPRNETEKKNDIQSLVFEWAGAVDYYKDGMMYYAAPPQIVENKVYGAVRNAWYKFKIKGINNIGIPVHDESMPIVPNWDNPFDQINVEVNVLGWHEFDYTIKQKPF